MEMIMLPVKKGVKIPKVLLGKDMKSFSELIDSLIVVNMNVHVHNGRDSSVHKTFAEKLKRFRRGIKPSRDLISIILEFLIIAEKHRNDDVLFGSFSLPPDTSSSTTNQ